MQNPSLSSSLILQHQQSTIKQKREKCEETIGLLAADGKQISTAPRVPFHLSPILPHPRRQHHCVALAFAFASHLPFTSCSPGLVAPLMFVVLPPLCISPLCRTPTSRLRRLVVKSPIVALPPTCANSHHVVALTLIMPPSRSPEQGMRPKQCQEALLPAATPLPALHTQGTTDDAEAPLSSLHEQGVIDGVKAPLL